MFQNRKACYVRSSVNVHVLLMQLEKRLEEGEMLSFNNRRVLHARRGFELNGGVRHMQVSAAFWDDDVTSCESVNFVV